MDIFHGFDPIALIALIISIIALIASVVFHFFHLQNAKTTTIIAHAEFIAGLNKSFVENEGYMELYTSLHECWNKKCSCSDRNNCDPGYLGGSCCLSIPNSVALSYLTFFETIYSFQKSKVIPFEVIDDLFAHRFFVVVHSKYIQQEILVKHPFIFKNIFCLEREWLAYRKMNDKKSMMPVYDALLLKNLFDMVDVTLYSDLVKECNLNSRTSLHIQKVRGITIYLINKILI